MERSMKDQTLDAFVKAFGGPLYDVSVWFAPGRVNLIGEHTDYNGGHVFPCALTMGTYAAVRRREDRRLRFYSTGFPEEGIIETSLDELVPEERFGWTNYPKGVIKMMADHGHPIETGFEMAVCGDIPSGAGLSSSASIEVLTALILCGLYGDRESGGPVRLFRNNDAGNPNRLRGEIPGKEIFFAAGVSREDIARICQESENVYNGCSCGIMDQFAVTFGKKDHAIFLDTASLEYETVPVRMDGHAIVITNTNVKHKLTDSKYNERRRECETALSVIRRRCTPELLMSLSAVNTLLTGESYPTVIRGLCDLDSALVDAMAEKWFQEFPEEERLKLIRRMRHAASENERCKQAVRALREGNLTVFGILMNASHISLRDDYEVTGPELDALAEAAWEVDGCLGSRMTGGGFGGCTVSIVQNDALERFKEHVAREYRDKTGLEADFYIAGIGSGPRKL